MKNRYGLSRHIPAPIQREVRQRSKFGCVVCRSGFYEYEHIDPPFVDAQEHDPARICCLCPSCHDAVTRGQRSKASVMAAYASVQAATLDEVGNPIGPIDLYGGYAELRIGGLRYSPAVKTILRYHGEDVIRVEPGNGSVPGQISAIFTDDLGVPTLGLNKNVWEGSTESWDIQVVGQRITVKTAAGRVALRLRLDPPGVLIVEQLDMRLADSHLLVTEDAYAAGRYIGEDSIAWVFADLVILRSTSKGCAIEFANPQELQARHDLTKGRSQFGFAANGDIVSSSGAGVLWIPAGIAIATMCGDFREYGFSMGVRGLDETRQAIKSGRNSLIKFIGTGAQ